MISYPKRSSLSSEAGSFRGTVSRLFYHLEAFLELFAFKPFHPCWLLGSSCRAWAWVFGRRCIIIGSDYSVLIHLRSLCQLHSSAPQSPCWRMGLLDDVASLVSHPHWRHSVIRCHHPPLQTIFFACWRWHCVEGWISRRILDFNHLWPRHRLPRSLHLSSNVCFTSWMTDHDFSWHLYNETS